MDPASSASAAIEFALGSACEMEEMAAVSAYGLNGWPELVTATCAFFANPKPAPLTTPSALLSAHPVIDFGNSDPARVSRPPDRFAGPRPRACSAGLQGLVAVLPSYLLSQLADGQAAVLFRSSWMTFGKRDPGEVLRPSDVAHARSCAGYLQSTKAFEMVQRRSSAFHGAIRLGDNISRVAE